MSATKVLWGQILIVFAIVLATTWAATQWTAWRLGFQPELGFPWFELAHVPVYLPPAFFWWWYAYDAYAPRIFVEGAFIAASGGFLSIAVAIGMSVWRAREAKRVVTYGSARWATAREICGAGLLGPDGVVLGRFERAYLRHDGPEHVLCFAPTRSGKGVGLVVPTLLTWPGSAIVHDIKGENWNLTAGFRARQGSVLKFDPTNTESAAYNPLLEVRRGEAATNCLMWRWEVQETMPPTDLSKPGADDRPLALHLVFPFSGGGVGLWQSLMRHLVASELGKPFAGRMLTYVWGGDRPGGSWLKNPFLPKDAALVILQPGTAPTSMWKREIVSFRQDYERIFGGKAPDPAYVAISGDSDDTHTRSVGYLSDLGFGRDPAACRDEP